MGTKFSGWKTCRQLDYNYLHLLAQRWCSEVFSSPTFLISKEFLLEFQKLLSAYVPNSVNQLLFAPREMYKISSRIIEYLSCFKIYFHACF